MPPTLLAVLTKAPFEGQEFAPTFFTDLELVGMTKFKVFIHPTSNQRFLIFSFSINTLNDILDINAILHSKDLLPMYKIDSDNYEDSNEFPFV